MIPCIQIYYSVLLLFSFKIPEVLSYAKVSKNGQEMDNSQVEKFIETSSPQVRKSEGRSVHDFIITAAPVYVTARSPNLQPGEAIDHPKTESYSTLDQDMINKLDALKARKQAQQRFHPPAGFEHSIAHSNSMKQQKVPELRKPVLPNSRPVGADISFKRPDLSDSYDYLPSNFGAGNSQPTYAGSDDYPPSDSDIQIPSSYGSDTYQTDHGPDHDSHDTYGSKPVYGEEPPKAVEYETHFDRPSFSDSPYSQNHDHHHDVIYDHIPDDHVQYHDHTTTEEPEMNDQRLSKRPYSYYYIGKKLWYVPLYFSIYFIIYIAALVLKSVARHKINFPANLAAATADARSSGYDQSSWWDYTVKILEAIDKYRRT